MLRFLFPLLICTLFASEASALGVADLTNAEASKGLKAALIQGAVKAVGELSKTDGFLANPEVKIPLPSVLKKTEKAMRMLGMGKQLDDLELRMNRAAEAAVPEAKTLLVEAAKKMTLADAKAILGGSDDAATQYFKKHTFAPMSQKFLPVVEKATANVQLAQQYNKLIALSSQYGVVKKDQLSIEQYVTQKTLDGVYLMMAKEEAAIRKDPVAQGSALLKKVFGALAK
jgi:hypothetical protein